MRFLVYNNWEARIFYMRDWLGSSFPSIITCFTEGSAESRHAVARDVGTKMDQRSVVFDRSMELNKISRYDSTKVKQLEQESRIQIDNYFVKKYHRSVPATPCCFSSKCWNISVRYLWLSTTWYQFLISWMISSVMMFQIPSSTWLYDVVCLKEDTLYLFNWNYASSIMCWRINNFSRNRILSSYQI